MAQEHALFANCLTCGRVLCVLDKGEACSFCGEDPLRAPDMDRLMERIATATASNQRLHLGLEEAQKKMAQLVAADSQESGAGAKVLDEAQDQTAATFFQHPSYTTWESIQEAKDRHARARAIAEDERASHRHPQLATLLGLK